MEFFIPGVPDNEAEHVYADLARLCGVPVPPLGERIQQITFTHDGEDWTAAVGQHLRGSRTERKRRRGRMVDVTTRLSDSATCGRSLRAPRTRSLRTPGRWARPGRSGRTRSTSASALGSSFSTCSSRRNPPRLLSQVRCPAHRRCALIELS